MSQMNNENEGGLPKSAIAGIVIIVVAAIAVFVLFGQKSKFEPVKAGSESIDFTLPDLAGKDASLKDYRGKVVFLNFWATWCKPCQEEMPSMQEMYQRLKGQPFEIVAVSVDTGKPEVISDFVRKFGLTFKILHDRRGKIKETYKTTGVPETFIIDQNGNIAEKIWGPRDWSDPASSTVIVDILRNGPKPRDAYKAQKG